MLKRPPRVIAIQDLSGFGRCSLSVILPTLSAMKVQVCPVVTAVLSTHTGGLGEVVFRDLTHYLSPALEHYKKLELSFECVYSGFLGSLDQIDHCLQYFAAYPDAFAVVDPVMGDNGKAYRTYTPDMCRRMNELVAVADMITPNLTEASILLGVPYPNAPMRQAEAKSLVARLSELGPRYVTVTGVELADGKIANIGYDRERGQYWRVDCNYVPASYPGTGDIFTSVMVGAMLGGDSLPMAMERATRFLEIAIRTTFSYGSDTRYGVMLESCLSWLTQDQMLDRYRLL
ncbi:MAG: pyridoxamine kinase [Clostridiales bacterium]|nr:MAG: pyridoxamine kinase [Clostridiales bacterium]